MIPLTFFKGQSHEDNKKVQWLPGGIGQKKDE
jgi:hypothetical protein